MDVGSCLLQQTASRTAGPAGGMPLSYRETVIGWRAQTTDEAQRAEAGILLALAASESSEAVTDQIRNECCTRELVVTGRPGVPSTGALCAAANS